MLGRAPFEILSRQENGLRPGDVIVLVSSGERSDADKSDFTQIRNELIRAGIRMCLVRVPPVLEKSALKEVTDISELVKESAGQRFRGLQSSFALIVDLGGQRDTNNFVGLPARGQIYRLQQIIRTY